MPLYRRPTKVKNSFYLLVPSDLARLGDINETTEFELEFEKNNGVRLAYTTLPKRSHLRLRERRDSHGWIRSVKNASIKGGDNR